MKIYLDICTALLSVAIALSVVPALLAGMAFDAPGSDNPATYLMVFSLMSFPLVGVIGLGLAWRRYNQSYRIPAALAVWLPLLNVAAFTIGHVWSEVGYNAQFGS